MESSAKRSICSLKKLNRLGKSIVALFLCIILVLGYSYRCPVQVHATAGFWETAYDVLVAQILNSMGVKVSGDVSDEQYNTIVGAIRKAAEDSLKSVNQQGLFQTIWNAAKNGYYTVTQQAWDAVSNAWQNYQHEADLMSGFGINRSYSGTFSGCYELEKNFYMVGDSWSNSMSDSFIKSLSNWQAVACTTLGAGDIAKDTSHGGYTVNKILCGHSNAYISLILNQDGSDKLYLNDADTFSKNLWFKGTSVSATNIKAFNCWQRNSDLAHYTVELNSQIKVLKAYCSSNQHDYLLFFDKEKPVNNVWSYWFYYYTDATANGINISEDGYSFGQNELVDRSKILAEGKSIINYHSGDADAIWNSIKAAQEKAHMDTSNGIQVKADATAKNPADVRARTQAQTTGLEATAEDTAADEAANAGKSTIPASASDIPNFQLPTGLQKKFPFCLPWDLVACYKLFQVPAKAPVWSIPVSIDQGLIHVHQTYTYDMNSNGIMDNVLPVFKWFLNIAVVLGLIAITKKIMS